MRRGRLRVADERGVEGKERKYEDRVLSDDEDNAISISRANSVDREGTK